MNVSSERRTAKAWTMLTLFAIMTIFSAAVAQTEVRSLEASDGALLAAQITRPSSTTTPTVLLWHQLGLNKTAYGPLVSLLTSSGYGSVNIDLRGHGQSTATRAKAKLNFETFKTGDWAKLPGDALTAINYSSALPGMNKRGVILIGSSIGANTVSLVGGDPRVKGLILLSPGSDYHELKPVSAIKGLTKPVLIVVGNGDKYSAESVSSWGNLSPNVKVLTIETSAHGNYLLKNQGVLRQVFAFIQSVK